MLRSRLCRTGTRLKSNKASWLAVFLLSSAIAQDAAIPRSTASLAIRSIRVTRGVVTLHFLGDLWANTWADDDRLYLTFGDGTGRPCAPTVDSSRPGDFVSPWRGFTEVRLACFHIAPRLQGMQKYEMARTKSFSYSAFNLEALTAFAATVAPLGIDLYRPVTPGAPGILTAIDALLPYDSKHPWPHEQIVPDLESSLCPALVLAGAHTHDAKYIDAQKRFVCKRTALTMIESLGN